MAILEHKMRPAGDDRDADSGMVRHRITREEYYRLCDPSLRTELIEGDIIELPPPGPRRRKASLRLYNILFALFGDERYVMHESAVVLAETSEPLPDVVVTTGPEADYDARHPNYSEMCLVIEVADSSVYKDRHIKAALYAGKGIPEYWIVNLAAGQVEVYRNPGGEQYDPPLIYMPGESVASLFAPEQAIPVSDFIV